MGLPIELQLNGTASWTHHAHDAFHERALAIAIGAQQGHGLALADVQADAVKRLHRTIVGGNIVDV
jgi:hypothetical protein